MIYGAIALAECPVPRFAMSEVVKRIAFDSCRLNLIHALFAPQWLLIASVLDGVLEREWKHWWAVCESDRLRLRTELEALVAHMYGLVPETFDAIVSADPSNPKGFWRIDKDLPYEERLTGLSARAFRALKEGKWSAETVGLLSNDEFFDLLGIPELTNAKAAQAKGLSGPLILKRDGCHSWQPENFPKDDPRHGWTWDDCRNDAITLLGSEEALEEYIAQATATGEEGDDEDEEPDPNYAGPKDLFGNPVPTDLFGHQLRPKKKRRGK